MQSPGNRWSSRSQIAGHSTMVVQQVQRSTKTRRKSSNNIKQSANATGTQQNQRHTRGRTTQEIACYLQRTVKASSRVQPAWWCITMAMQHNSRKQTHHQYICAHKKLKWQKPSENRVEKKGKDKHKRTDIKKKRWLIPKPKCTFENKLVGDML